MRLSYNPFFNQNSMVFKLSWWAARAVCLSSDNLIAVLGLADIMCTRMAILLHTNGNLSLNEVIFLSLIVLHLSSNDMCFSWAEIVFLLSFNYITLELEHVFEWWYIMSKIMYAVQKMLYNSSRHQILSIIDSYEVLESILKADILATFFTCLHSVTDRFIFVIAHHQMNKTFTQVNTEHFHHVHLQMWTYNMYNYNMLHVLDRKLCSLIEEYIARVGQQAVLVCCTPGKVHPHAYRVFGSQPLENVVIFILKICIFLFDSSFS